MITRHCYGENVVGVRNTQSSTGTEDTSGPTVDDAVSVAAAFVIIHEIRSG
jgi:hypothetical protein